MILAWWMSQIKFWWHDHLAECLQILCYVPEMKITLHWFWIHNMIRDMAFAQTVILGFCLFWCLFSSGTVFRMPVILQSACILIEYCNPVANGMQNLTVFLAWSSCVPDQSWCNGSPSGGKSPSWMPSPSLVQSFATLTWKAMGIHGWFWDKTDPPCQMLTSG